jgi:hypothetical protein
LEPVAQAELIALHIKAAMDQAQSFHQLHQPAVVVVVVIAQQEKMVAPVVQAAAELVQIEAAQAVQEFQDKGLRAVKAVTPLVAKAVAVAAVEQVQSALPELQLQAAQAVQEQHHLIQVLQLLMQPVVQAAVEHQAAPERQAQSILATQAAVAQLVDLRQLLVVQVVQEL